MFIWDLQQGTDIAPKLQDIALCIYFNETNLMEQKLTVAQLVNKFPASYETRRFITVFTRARHWSLS